MKFGGKFTRVYDSGTPANTTLGQDTGFDPYKDHTANIAAHAKLKECMYESRTQNINGFPAQRLVVGYMPPSGGTAIDLKATMYLMEDTSNLWYIVASGVALPKGGLAYFDTPAVPDNANTVNGTGSAGSLRVILIVSFTGTPNDGEHTFVIGTDASNPGI